ncbi:MAG: DUF4982 domain-containing protein [Bacilli bacterium]|jgi:beta-galactosidase|nr:DUF4982 domain-containing protein [Bacilli bacterium]MCH4277743.1 DUF4982 domain-containing protein [Bacilli bacterium]MCI2054858.1 DUF4982 domain-containing protein [Bacilli bacterium]
MVKIPLLEKWSFAKAGSQDVISVDLPYDAMLRQGRDEKSPSKNSSGYFDGGDYTYTKELDVPLTYKDKAIYLEFEGVYHHAEVYINSVKRAKWENGYRHFYLEIDEFLKYGEKNEIKVMARNSDQPNSRWYSGSGIYRPVNLYIYEKEHILPYGLRVKTLSYQDKTIEIEIKANAKKESVIEILDDEKSIYLQKATIDHDYKNTLSLKECSLWSPDTPKMYTIRVKFGDDVVETRFGIRKVEATAEKGLLINGVKTLLKGACIHADNGILGACSYPYSELRKVRILKSYGYNAIRCAHNPCADSFLRACDEEGMLVMDEYADMWFMHKSKYDYATYLPSEWPKDLEAMLEKDYNHPSVIMVSLGNEVGESANAKGVAICKKMAEYVKANGNDYLTTAGINVFFNYLSSMGFGVYSDKKANKEKSVGSEFFNKLAGIFGDDTMKIGASLPMVDKRIKGVYSVLDVAGYNYGILRYKKDHKKYPKRVILGSETFMKDISSFLKMSETNPALIGDFVWSGMDYLGEAGIGSWEYKEYVDDFKPTYGWISAGSGRIDILGNPLGEALYTKVMYDKSDLEIAVRPLMNEKGHSPSAWKMSDALPIWAYEGKTGKKASVEVYSKAYRSELYLNDKLVGKKKNKKSGRTIYKVPYKNGELRVDSYSKDGSVVTSKSLISPSKNILLSMDVENVSPKVGEPIYVDFSFVDEKGVLHPLVKEKVSLEVSGGELLAFGNACPFNKEGYLSSTCLTYFGRCLGIVMAKTKGELTIKAHSRYGDVVKTIKIA